MKMLTFSSRTAKEILRDPVNLGFGLGFPVALILLLSAIQANIPVSMFEIENLAPGMTVFGLSFMTLFAATLIAKDRESALLQRLYTTPLTQQRPGNRKKRKKTENRQKRRKRKKQQFIMYLTKYSRASTSICLKNRVWMQ